MGFLVQRGKEKVRPQTVYTSKFFTVTLPESLVKLGEAKLEIFLSTSSTVKKTKKIHCEYLSNRFHVALLPILDGLSCFF